jgi:hypothetical protein
METNKVAPPPAMPVQAKPPAPSPSGSSLRLLILLGLLFVVVGAYGYDYFVLRPACNAAFAKIQSLVDTRNKQGVKTGSLVTSADVQKEIGRQPTWSFPNNKDGYTVEYYCWWGKTPLLSRRRHFIAVVYTGTEPRHFSAHYQEEPPAEALPTAHVPSKEEPGTTPAVTSDSDSAAKGPVSEPAADAPSDKGEPAKPPAPEAKPADGDKPAEQSTSEPAAKTDTEKPAAGAKENP